MVSALVSGSSSGRGNSVVFLGKIVHCYITGGPSAR